MGVKFRGFFAKCNIEESKIIIDSIENTWSDTIVKIMKTPCVGIAVKMPDLIEIFSNKKYNETGSYEISLEVEEKLSEIMYSLEKNLPDWSKNFPKQKFVYIDSDCFGGICLESGFVCNNGVVIFIQESEEKYLGNLLEKGEIQLKWYFEPLTRGYFDK